MPATKKAEETKEPGLNESILAARAEMQNLKRDTRGQVGRTPYMYVTLDQMYDEVVPILEKHGVLVRQPVTSFVQDGKIFVCVTTVFSKGEELDEREFFFEWREDPKATGSNITYYRRYSLGAYLCLVTEADDDGDKATEQVPENKRHSSSGPTRTSSPQTVDRPSNNNAKTKAENKQENIPYFKSTGEFVVIPESVKITRQQPNWTQWTAIIIADDGVKYKSGTFNEEVANHIEEHIGVEIKLEFVKTPQGFVNIDAFLGAN